MNDAMSEFEKQLIYTAFYREANMAPREIENLVGIVDAPAPPAGPTPPADSEAAAEAAPAAPVGTVQMPEPPEPIDPPGLTEQEKIGRRLVRAKRKKKDELTEADYRAMRNAVNHIRRHGENPPKNGEELEAWRYNLMVRGFNPGKHKTAPAEEPVETL
jgi:hypothetical protein